MGSVQKTEEVIVEITKPVLFRSNKIRKGMLRHNIMLSEENSIFLDILVKNGWEYTRSGAINRLIEELKVSFSSKV